MLNSVFFFSLDTAATSKILHVCNRLVVGSSYPFYTRMPEAREGERW